jgi:hypothetical protein
MMTKTPSAARAAKRLRILSLASAGLLMLVATVPAPAAITPSNVDPWQHIVDCAAALLSNPAEHAEFCSPGHAEAMTFKSSNMWTDISPPPPPPESSSSIELPPPDCVECN